MRVDGMFTTTIDLLGKSIDLRSRNQNLIASNIANAETPQYVPKTLSFENELQGALKHDSHSSRGAAITNNRHIPLKAGGASGVRDVTGKIIETPAKTPGKDGNAVEMEDEMGKMVENQIMFNASVQMLTKKFDGLRTAIKGGN